AAAASWATRLRSSSTSRPHARAETQLLLLFGGFAGLAALGVHLGLDELWEAIGRADPSRLAAFLALSITVFVLYATRGRLVLRPIAATPPPPLPTLVAFRAGEHSVSTLLPSAPLAGEPVRAL